ncbi:MAG TPA: universal stress protein, partial [Verrucomicrobiae bacterium]
MKHTELLNRKDLRHVERVSAYPGDLTWKRSADARWENEAENAGAILLPPQSVIVVGMDFTDLALKAMDCALALAGRFDASLLMLHVLNPFFTSGLANRITRNKARTEARRRAETDLQDLALAK